MSDNSEILTILRELRHGQAELKADVGELKADVGELKKGQAKLEADVGELKKGQAKLEAEVGELKKGQAKLKLGQEDLSGRVDLVYSLLEFSSKLNQRSANDMHRLHKEAMDNINRLGLRVGVLEEN